VHFLCLDYQLFSLKSMHTLFDNSGCNQHRAVSNQRPRGVPVLNLLAFKHIANYVRHEQFHPLKTTTPLSQPQHQYIANVHPFFVFG